MEIKNVGGRVSPSLRKNFRLSPASLSVCGVFNRLARRRAHRGKKSQQNIFNLCCVPDEKKKGPKKNRNEKAEIEREVLQCVLSYDRGFFLHKKVLCRYHSSSIVTAWSFDTYVPITIELDNLIVSLSASVWLISRSAF